MAGNAWKYSHKLDDYDLMFMQHDFITIKLGVDYYGFSERPFLRMAKEAGAYYKMISYFFSISIPPILTRGVIFFIIEFKDFVD